MQRVDAWWPDQFFWPDPDDKGTAFYCVYESPEGVLDGYAAYRFEARWGNGPEGTLHVGDLVSVTPAARAVLWRYLLDVDLVATITAWVVPIDEPLRWLLRESRRMAVRAWARASVRVLERACRAVGACAAPGRVFEVVGALRPDGGAAGRFVLDGGPDGAEARRTTDEPDLVLEVADLGGILLGGVRPSALAEGRAHRRADPRRPLAIADAMFCGRAVAVLDDRFLRAGIRPVSRWR